MTGRELEYLIKIKPDFIKKDYDSIKEKIKDLEDKKNIELFTPEEARRLKGLLNGVINDAGDKAGKIGKKLNDGISKDNLKSALGFDTDDLKEAVNIANKLSEVLTKATGNDNWMKSSEGFLKTLTKAQGQVKEFQEALKPIGSGFDEIGTAIVKMSDNINNLLKDISELKNKTIIPSNIIDDSQKSIDKFKETLDSISNGSYKFEIEAEINEKKLKEKAKYIKSKYDEAIKGINNLPESDDEDKEYYIKRADYFREVISSLKELELIQSKLSKIDPKYNIGIKNISKELKDQLQNAQEEYEYLVADFADYTKSNPSVQIGVNVPTEKQIVDEINTAIDRINQKRNIHKIQLDIGDIGNIIEDKVKQAYKDNPEDLDVNTTELIEKTNKRLDAIDNAIKKKQEEIKKNATEWRKAIKDTLSFKNGEIEFNFGKITFEQLYNDLQQYFEENLLDIHINKDILKQEIVDAVGANNISVGGGNGAGAVGGIVTLDPKTLALAIKAALTGDYSAFEPKQETPSPEQKKEKKHLYLDPSDKQSQITAESFRAVAQNATKDNTPAKKLRQFFDMKGIDISKLAEGTTMDILDALSKLIESSGTTIIDQFDEFMKGSKNNTNLNFRKDLNELLLSLNINNESMFEETRRIKSIDVFKDYLKKAELTYGINDIQRIDRKNYQIPTSEEILSLINSANEQGFAPVAEALEVLKNARDEVKDIDNYDQKQTFINAVQAFKQNISKFYKDMIGYISTFEMDVDINGVKKPYRVRGRKNLKNIQDRINGDESKISDVRIYKDPSTGRLGTSTKKRESQMIRAYDGKSNLLVQRPDGTDILHKEVKYEDFLLTKIEKLQRELDELEKSDMPEKKKKKREQDISNEINSLKNKFPTKAVIKDELRTNGKESVENDVTKNEELIKKSEQRVADLSDKQNKIQEDIQKKRDEKAAIEAEISKNEEEAAKYGETKGVKATQKKLAKAEEDLRKAKQARDEAQNNYDNVISIDNTQWEEKNKANKKKINTYRKWLKDPEKYRKFASKDMYDQEIRSLTSEQDSLYEDVKNHSPIVKSIKDKIENIKKLQDEAVKKGKFDIVEQKEKEIKDLEYKIQDEEVAYEKHVQRMLEIDSRLNILNNRRDGKDIEGYKADLEEYLNADFNEKTSKPTGRLTQALADQEELDANIRSAKSRKIYKDKAQKANKEYEKAKQKRDEIANSDGIVLGKLQKKKSELTSQLTEIENQISESENLVAQKENEKKITTTKRLESAPQQKKIEQLQKKINNFDKKIIKNRKKAETIDKFVRDTYKLPEYNLGYSEEEKNIRNDFVLKNSRSLFLKEIVDKNKKSIDYSKESVKEENLTEEMKGAINSLFASRTFIDEIPKNFNLDKFSNESDLKAEINKRLQSKTVNLSNGTIEFYNRIINDGLESAQNWLNQTLQANRDNIEKQKNLISSLSNKDFENYKTLQPDIEKADERLKGAYKNQITEWFNSINDKIALRNNGNLDKQQEALIIKEISELFNLINDSVRNYKNNFKEELLSKEQQSFFDNTRREYDYNNFLGKEERDAKKKRKSSNEELNTLIAQRQPLLESRKAEILAKMQESTQAGKKTPKLDKELAAINEELAIYNQRAIEAENANWISVFKDDAGFVEEFKKSLHELIVLQQEAETAKYKGESEEELAARYAKIDAKSNEHISKFYEQALGDKQKSLLGKISTLQSEGKSTKELEDSLKQVNEQLVLVELNKRRINDSQIGGLIYEANVSILDEYNRRLKELIELEQKLALQKAKGSPEDDITETKKDITDKRNEFNKEIKKRQEARREYEAANSPRAQAFRYLNSTEKAYQTALQQRYTIKGRIKRTEEQYDDVKNDANYSTSWQYKKHFNQAKDRVVSEYVSSDAYRQAREAAYTKVDEELAQYIEKEILPEFENGIRERAKIDFEKTETAKEMKLVGNDKFLEAQNQYVEAKVQEYVQGVLHNISYNKDMPDTGEVLKENAVRMLSYGMQDFRMNAMAEFKESHAYINAQNAVKQEEDKVIQEAISGLKETRRTKIDAINEEKNAAISLLLKATENDYQPLKDEMKNISVEQNTLASEFSKVFDKNTLAAFDSVNRKEQLINIRKKLKGMPKGAERDALQAQHDFLNDNDAGYFKNVVGRLVDVAKQYGISESDVQQLYKELEGLGTQKIRKVYDWVPRIFNEFFNRSEDEIREQARSNLIAKAENNARRNISRVDSEYSKEARPIVSRVRENLAANRYTDVEDITDPKLEEWAKKNRDFYNLIETYLQDTMRQWLESNFQGMIGDKAQGLLDVRKGLIEKYVKNIVKDFASGLQVKNGMLGNINIRKEVEDSLVAELEYLRSREKPVNDIIADIEEQRRNAMKFGGIKNDETAQMDVREEQATLVARLNAAKEKQKALTEEINNAEKDGSTISKGRLNGELDKINCEIEKLQTLIDNRETLIRLRKEEQKEAEAASKWTPEEQKLWLNNKIELEKAKLDTGDESTKKKAEENIARYTEWLSKIESRMAEQNKEPEDKGIIGMIASAIRESLGGANGGIALDASGLATENTLQRILTVLGGNGRVGATTPDMEAKLARIRELEEKQRAFQARNVENGAKNNSSTDKAKENNTSTSNSKISEAANKIANDAKEQYKKDLAAQKDVVEVIKQLIPKINVDDKSDAMLMLRNELHIALGDLRNKAKSDNVKPSSINKNGNAKYAYDYLAEHYGIEGYNNSLKLVKSDIDGIRTPNVNVEAQNVEVNGSTKSNAREQSDRKSAKQQKAENLARLNDEGKKIYEAAKGVNINDYKTSADVMTAIKNAVKIANDDSQSVMDRMVARYNLNGNFNGLSNIYRIKRKEEMGVANGEKLSTEQSAQIKKELADAIGTGDLIITSKGNLTDALIKIGYGTKVDDKNLELKSPALKSATKVSGNVGVKRDELYESQTLTDLFKNARQYNDDWRAGIKMFREMSFAIDNGKIIESRIGNATNTYMPKASSYVSAGGHTHPEDLLFSSTDIYSLSDTIKQNKNYKTDYLITPDRVVKLGGLDKVDPDMLDSLASLFDTFEYLEPHIADLAKHSYLMQLSETGKTLTYDQYSYDKNGALTKINPNDIPYLTGKDFHNLMNLAILSKDQGSLSDDDYSKQKQKYENELNNSQVYRNYLQSFDPDELSITSTVRDIQGVLDKDFITIQDVAGILDKLRYISDWFDFPQETLDLSNALTNFNNFKKQLSELFNIDNTKFITDTPDIVNRIEKIINTKNGVVPEREWININEYIADVIATAENSTGIDSLIASRKLGEMKNQTMFDGYTISPDLLEKINNLAITKEELPQYVAQMFGDVLTNDTQDTNGQISSVNQEAIIRILNSILETLNNIVAILRISNDLYDGNGYSDEPEDDYSLEMPRKKKTEQPKTKQEYNDVISVGYDRIQKLQKIRDAGFEGLGGSTKDLLRVGKTAWDEIKQNDFFKNLPLENGQRFNKIQEVINAVVQKILQDAGMTEEQVVNQLANIVNATGGNFKNLSSGVGWNHFSTYNENGNPHKIRKENGLTYKVYASFENIKDFNAEIVSSIMKALSDAGFKGQLKTTTGSDGLVGKLKAIANTDQLVVHGASKKDQEIAYNVLRNMGLNLSYLGGGIDTPDGSFTDTLASNNIGKYVSIVKNIKQEEANTEQQILDTKEKETADAIKQTAETEKQKQNISETESSLSPIQDIIGKVTGTITSLVGRINDIQKFSNKTFSKVTDELGKSNSKVATESLNGLIDSLLGLQNLEGEDRVRASTEAIRNAIILVSELTKLSDENKIGALDSFFGAKNSSDQTHIISIIKQLFELGGVNNNPRPVEPIPMQDMKKGYRKAYRKIISDSVNDDLATLMPNGKITDLQGKDNDVKAKTQELAKFIETSATDSETYAKSLVELLELLSKWRATLNSNGQKFDNNAWGEYLVKEGFLNNLNVLPKTKDGNTRFGRLNVGEIRDLLLSLNTKPDNMQTVIDAVRGTADAKKEESRSSAETANNTERQAKAEEKITGEQKKRKANSSTTSIENNHSPSGGGNNNPYRGRSYNGLTSAEQAELNGLYQELDGGALVAQDKTSQDILTVLRSIKDEGVAKGKGSADSAVEKEKKKTEATKIYDKAIAQKDAILNQLSDGSVKDEYVKLLKQAEGFKTNAKNTHLKETDRTNALKNLKVTANKLDNLTRKINKDLADLQYKETQGGDAVVQNYVARNGNDVRANLEAMAQDDLNGAKYTFGSFDKITNTLKYTLEDTAGNITNVTMAYNEMYGKVIKTSEATTSAFNDSIKQIQKYDTAITNAKDMGYLTGDEADLERFKSTISRIVELNESVQNGNKVDAETFRIAYNEALKYGEATKKIADKNKRAYTSRNETRAADKQYGNLKAEFGNAFADTQFEDKFDFSDDAKNRSKVLQNYLTEYQNLQIMQKKFIDENTIGTEASQKALSEQAAKVRILGQEFKTAAKTVVDLNAKIEQSKESNFIDKKGNPVKMGGMTETDSVHNLRQQMEDYAVSLGHINMENVKYSNTKQQMTFDTRLDNETVAKMIIRYNEATRSLALYTEGQRESLTGLKAFGAELKKKMGQIIQYTASITSIYRVWGTIRQGVQYVKEIDAALTELKKVTNETEETYDKFLNTAAKTASKVGSTIKDVVSSTADWARLGYSIEDATQLAESTQILLNVSEFSSVDDASSALISSLQAFNVEAENSMSIVDKMNEIGNRYAISSSEIATALKDSASSLVAANNGIEESIALTAAANKVVQDASSVGSALRTISLRLRGTSTKELSEAGEDTEGVVTSKSKLRSKIQSLSGVDILTETGAYKSTYEILLEISKVWKKMSDIDQAALLELIAGEQSCRCVQKCA